MQHVFIELTELLTNMVQTVIGSLAHNWIPLSLAILTAAIMTVYMDAAKLKGALLRNPNVSIWGSVAVGAFTPLCACGTMAVILGMLSTTLPWGPIMAFLTSSPLMSPDGFIMVAGILSLKFAIALTLASIVIGMGAGYATHLIEKKTDFLKNQTRFAQKSPGQACGCAGVFPQPQPVQTCACAVTAVSRPQPVPMCGCTATDSLPQPVLSKSQLCCAAPTINDLTPLSWLSDIGQAFAANTGALVGFLQKLKWRALADAVVKIGVKQILLYYAIFVAIGFLINTFVPTALIMTLFSANNILAVPFAALIGLPLYVTTESSIPLMSALTTQGASEGAMLAFMITGPGTSAWVIAGITTILKKRAISLYVAFLLAGGILSGYCYDLLMLMGK
ncbi:permease [Candidatus Vecturithrix granuli]|uniref:Permease n=1 Tax=Vecturithrix granuli TaxID=1499967 RepID=A0A081BZI8_VECG1|nr:permease [Candidatus Vecturithrix granuli]